jgi:hypothetical protein
MRQIIALLLALFLVSASWSQEAEESADPEAAESSEESIATLEEDDSDLDEQGYGTEEEEDDFIPSEEVSADQSVAFPVDI